MKKKSYYFIVLAVMAPVPSYLDFNMDGTHPSNAFISYDDLTGILSGGNISVDSVTGFNTPQNSGIVNKLTIDNGLLSFSTGSYLTTITNPQPPGSVGSSSWIFGGDGTITVTGTIQNVAPGTDDGTTTVLWLLKGTITGATVSATTYTLAGQIFSVFEVAVTAFVDNKDPLLAEYFKLGSASSWIGNFNLGFYTPNSPNTAFTTTTIYSGDIINTPVPITAAFLLFGSGLFGLVCVRRRKI